MVHSSTYSPDTHSEGRGYLHDLLVIIASVPLVYKFECSSMLANKVEMSTYTLDTKSTHPVDERERGEARTLMTGMC